jgi:hypothetical protein
MNYYTKIEEKDKVRPIGPVIHKKRKVSRKISSKPCKYEVMWSKGCPDIVEAVRAKWISVYLWVPL